MNMKYIAYYRVSTQKQGQSGLGLEAQKSAVNDFLTTQGGSRPLVLNIILTGVGITVVVVVCEPARLFRKQTSKSVII